MANFVKGISGIANAFAVGSSKVKRILLGNIRLYPSHYDAEVSYLQNTGAEYIDTNITPDSNYKIECEFLFTSTSNYQPVFGSGIGYASRNLELYPAGGGTQFEVHYDAYANVGTCAANNVYKFVQDKGDITIYNADGSTNVAYSFGTKTFTCPYTMFLFALHRPDIDTFSPATRIMLFKMWNGDGTLVCDMIPVRVGTVGYMYDRVTESLFGNSSGSGAFVLGSDK